VNGGPLRVMAILRMFGEIAARSGRRAERTLACSDRADRLNPNIVFSKRDSYQRRGHLTVSEVESYRLTLPRTSTRQGLPIGFNLIYTHCGKGFELIDRRFTT